jgi:hypothetical protein
MELRGGMGKRKGRGEGGGGCVYIFGVYGGLVGEEKSRVEMYIDGEKRWDVHTLSIMPQRSNTVSFFPCQVVSYR